MGYPSTYSFCPHCTAALLPFTRDDIPRRQCPECGWIQYRNPTVGVAVLLLEESRLLLGQRQDESWCIPCGHVEWDETVEEAAVREMAEETGLIVELDGVFAVKSNFHDVETRTVGIWYRGKRTAGSLSPGGDLIDVRFIDIAQLPALKFPTDRRVVEDLRREMNHR